jgi:hypothetical protein
MIEIKPPEEDAERALKELEASQAYLVRATGPTNTGMANELHELNKTLKEILREMRKRKT